MDPLRKWIPKPNGELRPIGVTAIEDKIVQQALVWVMEQIYRTAFLGFSYGFRANRNQHRALDAVYVTPPETSTFASSNRSTLSPSTLTVPPFPETCA